MNKQLRGEIYYLVESKVFQYFSDEKHNSTTLNAFNEVVKVTDHTGLRDAVLTLGLLLVEQASTDWGTSLVCSYASHVAQCGVTTSHSTCCGYCVRDNHISFRLFALSNLSVPTLCLKDPQRGWG